MKYHINVYSEGDAFVMSSRDLPEFNSVAYSQDDIQQQALDGIETTFMIYMDDRKAIPLPSKAKKGEIAVNIPLRVTAKVMLFNEMLKHGVTKAELARRLGWTQTQSDRLLSLHHSTKLDSIERAYESLGKDLDLIVI